MDLNVWNILFIIKNKSENNEGKIIRIFHIFVEFVVFDICGINW